MSTSARWPLVFTAGVLLGVLLSRAVDLNERRPTLGATTTVTEASTGVPMTARVDTGAEITSVHCPAEAMEIVDPAADPRDNVGKRVKLRLVGSEGMSGTLTARIEGLIRVRNADHAEDRYQVRLRLRVGDVERDALVTLNDRSAMRHQMLLGRDVLRGEFLVDVDRNNTEPR